MLPLIPVLCSQIEVLNGQNFQDKIIQYWVSNRQSNRSRSFVTELNFIELDER